jgi:3',5'-cyclic-AMP phosphodiesterase
MKIIRITDTHIVAGRDSLYGLSPLERLNLCVDDINANHANADLCVVTGDLTDAGTTDAYVEFKTAISALKIPVQLMLGNHDNRANFFRIFPEVEGEPNGFLQSVRRVGDIALMFLDTNEPGVHSGSYCGLRQDWLRDQLSFSKGGRAYIFSHHQPFPIGWPLLDQIGVIDTDAIQTIMKEFRDTIKYIFFGHIHHTLNGVWNGIPFSAMPGTNHQIWWRADEQLNFVYTNEPAAYDVIQIENDQVRVYQNLFAIENVRELSK